MNFGHDDIDYAENNAYKSHTFDVEIHNRMIIDALLTMGGATFSVGEFRSRDRFAPMDIAFANPGLTVSRGGFRNFGVSILGLKGNTLVEGETATGTFITERTPAGKKTYSIRSRSPQGSESRTLKIPWAPIQEHARAGEN